MSRRLGSRALATALETRAREHDQSGLLLAQVGVPATLLYTAAEVYREAAGIIRSLGRSRRNARRLATVAALRAQGRSDTAIPWTQVRDAIGWHLLFDLGDEDPLTKRP